MDAGTEFFAADHIEALLPTAITYGPELNPVENIWEYLCTSKRSNSVFDTYGTIVDRYCAA